MCHNANVAQGTHIGTPTVYPHLVINYDFSYLFFTYKVDPLNLESENKLTFPWSYEFPNQNLRYIGPEVHEFWSYIGPEVHEFWSYIGPEVHELGSYIQQTDITTTLYMYIDISIFLLTSLPFLFNACFQFNIFYYC